MLGLMVILSFCLRSTILSGVFGVIQSEIPVLHYPIQDPTKHDFKETPNAWIKKTTPVVVLTILDGNTLGPNGEIDDKTKILVGVRDYRANPTHPNVISTPTQRIPKGLFDELSDRKPGMMTLIAIAISVAYIYSSLVVF